MEWRIRIDDSTYIASSDEELREWYKQGRVRPEHYAFHPVLSKWMYVGDLRELASTKLSAEPVRLSVRPPSSIRKKTGQSAARHSLSLGLFIVTLVAVTALLTVHLRRRPAQTKAADQTTTSTSTPAVAELTDADLPHIPAPADRLRYCRAHAGWLSSQARRICADAATSLASDALDEQKFDEARSTLGDAETFGADLGKVRKMRTRIPGYMKTFASSQTPSENSGRAPSVPANSTPGYESFDLLVRELSPLITSYEVGGPSSIAVHLNPSIWNGFSSDQQQQIGDTIASKAVVQNMRSTLHLFTYSRKWEQSARDGRGTGNSADERSRLKLASRRRWSGWSLRNT